MKIDESQIRRFADIVHDYDDFSVLIHYMFVFDKDPKYVMKEHISAQWVPLLEVTKLDWVGADLKASEMLEASGIE